MSVVTVLCNSAVLFEDSQNLLLRCLRFLINKTQSLQINTCNAAASKVVGALRQTVFSNSHLSITCMCQSLWCSFYHCDCSSAVVSIRYPSSKISQLLSLYNQCIHLIFGINKSYGCMLETAVQCLAGISLGSLETTETKDYPGIVASGVI